MIALILTNVQKRIFNHPSGVLPALQTRGFTDFYAVPEVYHIRIESLYKIKNQYPGLSF